MDPKKINKDLETVVTVLPKPFFILGDFNAHGSDWGCTHDDNQAPIIRDICDAHCLTILNSGEATRVSSPMARPIAIDLVEECWSIEPAAI